MVLNKNLQTNSVKGSYKAKATSKHRESGFLGLSEVLVAKPKPMTTQSNQCGSHSDTGVIRLFDVVSEAEDLGDSATSSEISYSYNGSSTPKGNVGIGFEEIKVFGYGDTDTPRARTEVVGQTTVDRISAFGGLGGLRESENVSSDRACDGLKVKGSADSFPSRVPRGFQPRLASEQGTFCAVVSYDACVRLCLREWSLRGCGEVHCFLENECAVLRDAFGLRHVLLQSENELMEKQSSELVSQGATQKPRRTSGQLKLQVRKVKLGSESLHSCCGVSSLNLPLIEDESLQRRYLHFKTTMSSTFKSIQKVRVDPKVPTNGPLSRRSLAYLQASTEYMKQVSKLLKVGAKDLCSSSLSYDQAVQETYICLVKLKSSSDEDAAQMRPGSGEDLVFFPNGSGDYLVVEVQDSKGHRYGRVLAQVAAIADNADGKLKWWPIYSDPMHEPVGKVQLHISYKTTQSESSHSKCGSVAETVAYDFLLEVALKIQQFQPRNLLLKGPWRWLVTEFALYYGVSDSYTKLRYLSYIMDVATPTAYCLNLLYDLLSHVLMKGSKNSLSHQEKRILADVDDQVKDILATVFENYKSLDESSPLGMMNVFMPANGSVAPALAPAVKLYSLLHDILTPEAQLKLCRYFQVATRKRLRRNLADTDKFMLNGSEAMPIDLPTSCNKMKSLIHNLKNEVFTDMKIHSQHILPSFIELPNISSSIYSVDLSSRLQAFLVACPPPGPSPPVSQLVIAAADFQRDLSLWNVNPVNGGVNVKELFNSHIVRWIQEKRHELLESCKHDKVKASAFGTQPLTAPFIDDMFDRLEETINNYQIILCRWPEYISLLESAVADVEKATVEALERQFSDVLLPLKDTLTNKIFGHKYVQRLSKGTVNTYSVPDELGILLNLMQRLLDVLCPKIESQLKSWASFVPDDGCSAIGEHLNDVKVMLRAKFRSYRLAIVEKLAENTKAQTSTKLKSIVRDSKDSESCVHNKMQPLKDLLVTTIHQLDTVVETPVFIQICREFWERMGQDVLLILEDGKEKRAWYKGLRVVASILDDVFASEMQKLHGRSLQGKDLEPPGSITEIHSMLCKDASS